MTSTAATTAAPSNLVTNEDIKRTTPGTPARTVMTWAQAIQFGDVVSARRSYSAAVRKKYSLGRLDSAAREVGSLLGKPEIVTPLIRADEALVRVQLVSYGPRGQRSQQPTTFRLRREDGQWMIDDVGLLLETAEALRRARR